MKNLKPEYTAYAESIHLIHDLLFPVVMKKTCNSINMLVGLQDDVESKDGNVHDMFIKILPDGYMAVRAVEAQ